MSNTFNFAHIEKIIVAEDQLINIEVLKNQLNSFGLIAKTLFSINGAEAIKAAKMLVDEAVIKAKKS